MVSPDSHDDSHLRFVARGAAEILTFRLHPEAIRRRAQDLYRSTGCREGLSEFNWFQAQRELLMEASAREQPDHPLDDARILPE